MRRKSVVSSPWGLVEVYDDHGPGRTRSRRETRRGASGLAPVIYARPAVGLEPSTVRLSQCPPLAATDLVLDDGSSPPEGALGFRLAGSAPKCGERPWTPPESLRRARAAKAARRWRIPRARYKAPWDARYCARRFRRRRLVWGD